MDKPLVSVCIITYNHVKYIEQAIESVLMQQVDFPWEIIIADDCSTDGTTAIIQSYKTKYPDLIKLISRKKNVGPGLNFVELINAAKGKYIAYLEGDDYWIAKTKLKKQFDYIEMQPNVSLCYHKVKWELMYADKLFEKLEYSNENDPATSNIFDILNKGWYIRSCSMFFKAIQLPIGFENLYIGDYPLHFILATKGDIGFINEAMGVYRIHKYGISEQELLTNDFAKRRKNFKNELHVNSFLDKYSNGTYTKYFRKKEFEITYSYLNFVFKCNRKKILFELFSIFTLIRFNFLITSIAQKLYHKARIFIHKKEIKHI